MYDLQNNPHILIQIDFSLNSKKQKSHEKAPIQIPCVTLGRPFYQVPYLFNMEKLLPFFTGTYIQD